MASTDPARYVRTSYTHTLLDQRQTVTDQAGNTWSYSYDLRGRQTQALDPDKGTTTSTFDAAGNLATVTAPLGTGTATLALRVPKMASALFKAATNPGREPA